MVQCVYALQISMNYFTPPDMGWVIMVWSMPSVCPFDCPCAWFVLRCMFVQFPFYCNIKCAVIYAYNI